MDREELIAHMGEQIAFIRANVPVEHGRDAAVRNMEAIREGLETFRTKLALEGAKRFLHDIEDTGGVARGTRVGPKDEVPAIIYSSEASRKNHQYALWLLDTVREATAADGAPESQAAPGGVTAEQWQRAFDSEGPA